MNNLPIGVFDSGVGGLSVVKQIKNILPEENIIYFGDTARIPYGNKSIDTIKNYTNETVDFLLKKGVKAIVIACNTISAVAKDTVINKAKQIPVFDVISGCSFDIANKFDNIGIIATNATIKSKAYNNYIHNINPKVNIFAIASPLFVPMIEEGFLSGDALELIVQHYLNYFNDKLIDCLVLACTHYPFIIDIISKYLPKEVLIYDPAVITALNLKNILEKSNMLNLYKKNIDQYYVTDNIERFYQISSKLLININLNNINLVSF
jgi:glutamate racemase